MNKTLDNPTKSMFDCLAKLYKQSQLLLLDADRLMGDRGWRCMHSTGPAYLSDLLRSPGRWYARWAARFYMPDPSGGRKILTDKLLYVSVHFASDRDTEVNEPLVLAGRLIYSKQMMDQKTIDDNYKLWMCKYWFRGKASPTLEGWRQTSGPSRYSDYLKATETFDVPLYDITSSEKLESLVVNKLLPEEKRGD